MVVGWYHSHPGFGCWLSGVDINTQQVCCRALVWPGYDLSRHARMGALCWLVQQCCSACTSCRAHHAAWEAQPDQATSIHRALGTLQTLVCSAS